MFRNNETSVNFLEQIDNEIKLKSIVGLNLYRICQEIINNVFKHARASELTISIVTNKNITIKIADNGIGFNFNQNFKNSYGLKNIKNRANEADIQLQVNSKPSEGTSFLLLV